MTISLKSDASGNSGAIQVAGVDRLTLNLDGSLVAGANPATGNRSMALATMQMFANEFGASLAGRGYQKLPSGLIIQWGAAIALTGGDAQVNFPISFPSATLAINITTNNGSNSQAAFPSGGSRSLSSFFFSVRNTSGVRVVEAIDYIAIGY